MEMRRSEHLRVVKLIEIFDLEKAALLDAFPGRSQQSASIETFAQRKRSNLLSLVPWICAAQTESHPNPECDFSVCIRLFRCDEPKGSNGSSNQFLQMNRHQAKNDFLFQRPSVKRTGSVWSSTFQGVAAQRCPVIFAPFEPLDRLEGLDFRIHFLRIGL